jgi:hypothetical protein
MVQNGQPTRKLKEICAENIKNTYPTYSRVSEFVKMFRRTPIVGTFVSFPAEVIRVTYGTASLAKREMANPATRSIGLQRTAGLTLAMATPIAASIFTRYLTGMDAEDEKDFRKFLAPWSKNSTILYLGKEGDVIRSIDIGYSDPFAYLKKPFYALMNGDDLFDSGLDAIKEIMMPFIGEELLAGKLMDVARNKKVRGGNVYNPASDISDQLYDITMYIGEAIEPGAVTSGKRIIKGVTGEKSESGREYKLEDELIALATGQRLTSTNITEAFGFKVYDSKKQYDEAKRIYTKELRRKDDPSPESIERAKNKADKLREEIFNDMVDYYRSAIRLGSDERELRERMKESGISTDMIQQIRRGKYVSDIDGKRRRHKF